jgi:spermidine/putrescine transport system substrate-binding protein
MLHLSLTKIVLLTACACLLISCSGGGEQPVILATNTAGAPDNILNIYNWDTYIDPELLASFEVRFGAKINYKVYGSSDEMYINLKSNPAGYDLIVGTDYIINRLATENLLSPIDRTSLTNFANLDPTFLNQPFDPGNRYSIPYLWGTEGIGYNIKATGSEITSWKDLFNPKYKGRISFLADERSVLGAILMMLGYSPNTSNEYEIQAAKDFLLEHQDYIAVLAEDNGQDLLADGTVVIAHEYNGDIMQIASENPDIRYVIPSEGALGWMDNFVIPKNAAHIDLALKFINFMLDAKNAAALANYTQYSSPNKAALEYINPADLSNPAIYPDEAAQKRIFFIATLNETAQMLYDNAWAEFTDVRIP